ncbi:ribosome maturation factor RimP [Caloramator australicus]|jgi:ribosome maturation factor RimP|uniref:Ribosome maturation factor RimP n=2 Tax=Caloramator TaxID=44258 RepID=I7LGT2_9CLOT|nr:ribosome maturation factor RimP [Caloramator australicus]CCJ33530.1 COG0779: clustered with transcription termination protein NusA [Caloramator australicus RC3]
MNVKKIIEIVTNIARPIVEKFNLELVDVDFVKENNEWFLRVFIDKEGGITIDDCTNVSRILSDKLDEVDPISVSYYLEVSSPGINRPLKKEEDFIRFKGRKIKLKLFKEIDDKKILKGILLGIKENKVIVNLKDKEIEIDFNNISSANLDE